jgi:hypothetical protein
MRTTFLFSIAGSTDDAQNMPAAAFAPGASPQERRRDNHHRAISMQCRRCRRGVTGLVDPPDSAS